MGTRRKNERQGRKKKINGTRRKNGIENKKTPNVDDETRSNDA